jgi:uncharacterized membrane protein
MFDISFIVLARAIHVMAGVAWAGATFMLASAVVPLAARYGAEGAGRWLGMVARRAGFASMIAAILTVLSGIYLFAAVHAHDDSINAVVLKAGAAAALLSMGVGLLVGRPAGQKLEKLQQASAGGTPSADAQAQIAQLYKRLTMSARAAAGLLGLAVLAMAVFRYAAALG